jgi:hypothetical protein
LPERLACPKSATISFVDNGFQAHSDRIFTCVPFNSTWASAPTPARTANKPTKRPRVPAMW